MVNKKRSTSEVDTSTGVIAEPPFVRGPFVRERVRTPSGGVSRTHQAHADECDINKILARFDNTGSLPPGKGEGQYANVVGLQGDLTTRINHSREILDQAGRDLDEKRQRDIEEQIAEQKSRDEELERLRAFEAEVKKKTGDTGS